MSISMTERRIDKKRRVSIPSSASNLKEGRKVVVISSEDVAIISSNKDVAREISQSLHELETKRKEKFFKEWDDLLEKTGLLNLSNREIDRIVARGIRRPRELADDQ